jgi:hypothetical protein
LVLNAAQRLAVLYTISTIERQKEGHKESRLKLFCKVSLTLKIITFTLCKVYFT